MSHYEEVVGMKNPYTILEIRQDATDNEIEQARKYQLMIQCGMDINKKNEDGEYIQEVINQAAKDLLDPEKRKEIDEKIIKSIDLPIPYDSSKQLPSQIILTKINYELITQVPQIKFIKKVFDKKTKGKKLYVVILENSSFQYAVEKLSSHDKYWLDEYFTGKTLSDKGFKDRECPWDKLEVFECDSILAIAYPAYQILPISVVKNGRVADSVLRAIYPIIQTSVQNMSKETSKLFEDYKVKSKGKI